MITKVEAEKAYADLIQLRRSEVLVKDKANPGQIEFHHVLPRCCGGSDDQTNIVALYAKEHFMAHVYLWAIHHDDKFHYKMVYALNQMIKGTVNGSRTELRDFILQSEEYQKAREELAQVISKTIGKKILREKNGSYGKHWYSNVLLQKSMLFFDEDVPIGWEKGCLFQNNNKDKTKTIQKIITRANNNELQKRIDACREAFFSMYYAYYLKHGFELTVEKFDLKIERTALLHLFKKYVPSYKRYNRLK